MVEFRILGPLEIIEGGRARTIGSARQRDLLALLIARANEPVSTDRIIDELWGDDPPDGGARAVAFHVAKLRDLLRPGRGPDDPTPISTEPGGYALRIDPAAIDAVRFERLAVEARGILADDPSGAADRLDRALADWHGSPFADVDPLPELVPEIARLEELRLRATEDRIEAELELGRHAAVIPELERLVGREPLRERLRGQLMLALYRAGRQAAALDVYGEGRRRLAEELGIDPSPELQDLQAAILRQDPGLRAAPRPERPRNPYKGLRPFAEGDARDFFGREALTARLVDRLGQVSRGGRLLAVVGPSGSGKSSVVRAGLIPAIRAGALDGSERWPVVTIFPGARPLHELARGLASLTNESATTISDRLATTPDALTALVEHSPGTSERVLLVVDQAEELYTLASDGEERRIFVRRLLEALGRADGRLAVVLVFRADMYDQPLSEPDLGDLVRIGTEAVTPLDRGELERAIVRPAAEVGLELEAGLASEIVGDVAGRAGALPLMQYTLTELVDRANGRHLTRDAYRGLGGIAGAVGRRAEELYLSLEAEGQAAARQVFLRLIEVQRPATVVARRVEVGALRSLGAAASLIDDVLSTFEAARLLSLDREAPTGAATVEIAHEALLARWPRLAGWIEDEREALWVRHRLAEEAQEWERSGRDPADLLPDARLDRLEPWLATTDLDLDAEERAFVEESRGARARRSAERIAHAAQELRLRRGAIAAAGALAGVVMVAALLAVIVAWQQAGADEQSVVARGRELAAASIGVARSDPALALLLAAESARTTIDRGFVTLDTMDALDRAIQASRHPYPVDAEAVRTLAGGPGARPGTARGAYLLAPAALLGLAHEASDGAVWDIGACVAYLGTETCPGWPEAPATELEVWTDQGVVPYTALAGSIAGTVVRVWSELPAGDGGSDRSGALDGWLGGELEGEGVAVDVVSLTGPQLDARLAAGDLPDLLITARPGLIRELADQRELIALSRLVDTARLGSDLPADLQTAGWIAVRSGESLVEPFGIPIAASTSSLLWYRPADLAAEGFSVPQTWQELIDLAHRLPELEDPSLHGPGGWCLGAGSPPDSGSGPTDWLEELLLGSAGPRELERWVIDQWQTNVQRQLPRAELRTAFERLGDLAFWPDMERSDLERQLTLDHEEAIRHLTQVADASPPWCWFVLATAPEVAAALPIGQPGRLDAVPMPGTQDGGLRGRAYFVTVVRDRPEVRRALDRLIDPASTAALEAALAPTGVLPVREGGVAPRADSPLGRIAGWQRAAIRDGTFVLDASDRMPRPIGDRAIPEAVRMFLEWGPDRPPAVVEWLIDRLDQARTDLWTPGG